MPSDENASRPPAALAGSQADDALLGRPSTLSLSALARRSGVDEAAIRSYWRALGLPVIAGDVPAYTEDDADALAEIFSFADTEGLDHTSLTTLIRSTGHTTERLVLWQVEALVEHLARRHDLDDTSARLLMLERLPDLAPVLETQLVHAWRRQLVAVAGRYAVEFAHPHRVDDHELPLPRAVGFADIVNFTMRTSELGAEELADFVQRFEGNARDVISVAGGRVVKTVGDAVLFIADDVEAGARIALGLAGASTADDGADLAPVRVSLVWGRVLSRFGDVFGASVNLAARLTDIAEPSTVLVDRETADLLKANPEFDLAARPERDLRGIGRVEPVRLRWAYRG